ncbi:hypothetical protein ZWY2020_006134 [Hordeum vulgare]|nr:hypothetical protein ZWY2020_006134 [Hordeum vulgare]
MARMVVALRAKGKAGVTEFAGLSPGTVSVRTSVAIPEIIQEGVSAAKEGELLVCRSLGIMQDDEDITERALDELAARFKEQLPMDVMATPQALFKVDDDNTREMDDALFVHAGSSGLEDEVAPADGDAQAT